LGTTFDVPDVVLVDDGTVVVVVGPGLGSLLDRSVTNVAPTKRTRMASTTMSDGW
jgi:hypothetical protein